ncbi:DUF4178 domain-containing protein [Novosphingobium sp. 1949]|uniref:DUF4178 domain-containing protein n=1 Tax=Novosphingobium organovorum TaxID=2930092 RepID=A0ABT0BHC8_9SPHN|nr:DUF4178 domain-containing protein [Novosphingobium organovorum]MCJ2184201.1 DUF4178 domain-containing protein [Novosphingobium organovorum]
MPSITCPSCGAGLEASSAALPYSTCPYCQSLVLHSALGVEDMGKVAVLPFDMSPVQLGTRFRVEGQALTTLGRVRWGWSGGAWNEWLLESGDGAPLWLGEAMGLFMLTRERPELLGDPLVEAFARGEPIEPGHAILVDGTVQRATDVKTAQCLGSEGQLPFATLPGTQLVNADFRSRTGSALSLQKVGGAVSAWYGQWYELADLAPQGVRALDGWPLPAAFEGSRR